MSILVNWHNAILRQMQFALKKISQWVAFGHANKGGRTLSQEVAASFGQLICPG